MQITGEITYERQNRIGVGQGMNSEVWLALDPQLGGIIAVKEIAKANLINSVPDYFREAETMFSADHPNVVPIRAAWQTTDLICLGMDYFKKGSLQDRISNGPITLKQALRVGQSILSGLSHIHSRHVIHFDIKPSNVLFSDANEPMIADFGQSRRFVPPSSVISRPPMYMFGIPPECYAGIGLIQSDIYQVGLTLYRAVNGDPFFRDQIPTDVQSATIAGLFPRRQKFLPHVPVRLRTIIRTALAVNPADRYSNSVDFSNALSGVGVELDWKTTINNNGEMSWLAKRDGQPDLLVDLRQDGAKWKTEMYTRNGTAQRRARVRDSWQSGLTRNDALDSLKRIFAQVQQ